MLAFVRKDRQWLVRVVNEPQLKKGDSTYVQRKDGTKAFVKLRDCVQKYFNERLFEIESPHTIGEYDYGDDLRNDWLDFTDC